MGITKLDLLRDLDPLSAHIVASRRGKSGEIGKNREDLEAVVQRLIGRCVRPLIVDADVKDLSTLAPVTVTFRGWNLIPPGWEKATLNVPASFWGVADTALDLTAILPGIDANLLRVQFRAVGGVVVTWSLSGNDITIGIPAAGATPAAIVSALAGTASAYAVTSASAGVGVIPQPVAPTRWFQLSGGEGEILEPAGGVASTGVPNADLLFISRVPGPKGKSIRIEYVDAGAPTPVVVTTAGSRISVLVQAGVTLASDVRAAILGNDAAKVLVVCEFAPGNDGTGAVTAVAPFYLVYGSTAWDGNWTALVGGYDVGRIAQYTIDSVVVDFPALTTPPITAGGIAMVFLPLCGGEFVHFPMTVL